jgi:hypothetical protein
MSELENSRRDVSTLKNIVDYLANKLNRNIDLVNENKKNFPIMFMFSAPANLVFKKGNKTFIPKGGEFAILNH